MKKMTTSLIPVVIKKENKSDLFVMDISGKIISQVTDDNFEESDPSIIGNGKILFSSKRTGTWQLYISDIWGKNVIPITQDQGFNNYRPVLSIDGSILFVSDRDMKTKIYSIDTDGSNLTKLTDGDEYYDFPSPLDDGNIIYLSNEKNKWEIWKMSPDGSNKLRVSNIPAKPISLAAMPSYVKDSMVMNPGLDDSFVNRRNMQMTNFVSKAVFTARDKDGDLEIYRINLDGSDIKNLTQMPGVDANPVVLRNGKILFTSDRDGTFDVWMMEPDGFNPINISKEPFYASSR
ncbi:MAG: TolB family protein, partial [Candidatus Sericytochromatia bacterium]